LPASGIRSATLVLSVLAVAEVSLSLRATAAESPVSGVAEREQAAPSRPDANAPQAPSINIQNLQRRVAGVLPVRIDVPRAGHSFVFVRPLVIDEPTTMRFEYKMR